MPPPTLPYDQAQHNLDTGGLQGADLANAKSVLAGAYKQSPTVLTNTGIIEDKIPKLNSDFNSTVAPAVAPSDTQPANPDDANPLDSYFKEQYGAIDSDPTYSLEDKLINNMQESSDASTNAYINALKQQFSNDQNTMRQSQESQRRGTTASLIRSGASRYAPTIASGFTSMQNQGDLQALNKLQTSENLTIAQALDAKRNNDYQLLEKHLDQIKEIRAQKQDLAKQLYDTMVARQQQNQKDVNGVLTSLAKNGAPPDVIASVQGAGNLGEAIANAGDYLQEGTGTVGEYLYYKRDAIAHGQVPLSYNEYADMDANRKRSIVNVNGSGLSNNVLSKVTTVADQFKNEQTVQNYQTIAQGLESFKSLGNSPADDIQRVYTFAKTMDPNSAVREGEYKTVQEYAQAYLPSLGIKGVRLVDNRGFLTQQARDLMEKSLETKFKPVDASYKQIRDSYAKRINKISGQEDGTDYLTDYTQPVGDSIIGDENKAQSAVIDYGKNHPDAQAHIRQLAGVVQPDLGRAYTWSEIQQILGIQ